MQNEAWAILAIAMSLLVMQSLGGYFQIKNYQATVRSMGQKGILGIGKKKGGFLSGHIAIVACDNKGVITDLQVLDGISLVARFKNAEMLLNRKCIGSSIYDFLRDFGEIDKRRRKYYKGYIMAMEALETRLKGGAT